MKKLFYLFYCLPVLSMAQVFPFSEGFHGVPSGSLPAGWNGDMKVFADHGLADMKGLAADLGSADRQDSVFTPLIGPLTASTEVSFWYRMVEQNIYPSTPRTLTPTDKVTLAYSTDDVNYTTIYTIDTGNHQQTLNFRKVGTVLNNLAGQVVRFKIVCQHGGGGTYYTDIDTLVVRNDPNNSIGSVESENAWVLYPNPLTAGAAAYVQCPETAPQTISITDVNGRQLYTGQVSGKALLPVQQLSAGVYLVTVGYHTRRLIINRP